MEITTDRKLARHEYWYMYVQYASNMLSEKQITDTCSSSQKADKDILTDR